MVIYEVLQNSDLTEGHGPMRPVAHFEDEDDAWAWAEGWRAHCHQHGFGEVQVKPITVTPSSKRQKVHGIKVIHDGSHHS